MIENTYLQAACTSADDWNRLQNLLLQIEAPTLESLFEKVDQSDFSLTDWINALLDFDQWLSDQQIKARPIATMIGYISCCTMAPPATLTPPDLSRITRDMLETYGFDATTDILTTS